MKLEEAITLNERQTPEASIEYFRKPQFGYDKEGLAALGVRLNQLSLLTSKTFKLREFWEKQGESKLIDQFIKATFKFGRDYKIIDTNKKDFETYEYIITSLFGRKKEKPDITFYMEPGFNFKGLFKGDKFSIARIEHDDDEAKRGAWAHKEKRELQKLK